MPYPTEHAARIRDPGLFDPTSFRSKDIKTGIRIILGKLKGGDAMTTQAYRFSVDNFTEEEAKKWLKDHEVTYMKFEQAQQEQALQHVGVLGMHWGRRKSSSEMATDNLNKRQAKWDKENKDPKRFFKAYNAAADHANSVLIPRINKKYGKYNWSKLDTSDPYHPKGDPKLVASYNRYLQEYDRSFKKVFKKKYTELYGERPTQ